MVRRGDVHWAKPPKIGKHRFLIVQDDSFNRKFDEVLAVPIVSVKAVPIVSVKKEEIHSWEVEVPEETFPKPSIVNCSAFVLIEKSDLGDLVTSLDEKTMQGVDYALSITVGLQDW